MNDSWRGTVESGLGGGCIVVELFPPNQTFPNISRSINIMSVVSTNFYKTLNNEFAFSITISIHKSSAYYNFVCPDGELLYKMKKDFDNLLEIATKKYAESVLESVGKGKASIQDILDKGEDDTKIH